MAATPAEPALNYDDLPDNLADLAEEDITEDSTNESDILNALAGDIEKMANGSDGVCEIPFRIHDSEPAPIACKDGIPESVPPFTTCEEMCTQAQELASTFFASAPADTNFSDEWLSIVRATVHQEEHDSLPMLDDDEGDTENVRRKLVDFLIRLAKTSPTIFGDSFEILETKRAGKFTFPPDGEGAIRQTILHHCRPQLCRGRLTKCICF